MTSPYPKIGDPDFDPYELLGLEARTTPPSDADVTKAYRKLALKLHPDKQRNDLSETATQELSFQFHAIQEARSFLLEPEHAKARDKYFTKRASQLQRKRQDKEREQSMSQRRKRMRDDLKRKEEAFQKQSTGGTSQSEQSLLEKLRKEGKHRQEQYVDRQAQEHDSMEREALLRRKKSKLGQEERQVRLKWSRSRISISPSEDSLAKLMSHFGRVDHVEMLGSKGNSALVTFSDPTSCPPCVNFYVESDEMRATFVGARKQREEDIADERVRKAPLESTTKQHRDTENLEERKMRQAAEREELLRQMEMEESGGSIPAAESTKDASRRWDARSYPLEFPDSDEYQGLTPLQKLQQYEKVVFGNEIANKLAL